MTMQVKDRLIQDIDAILQRLSPERLQVAADFLAYLEQRETDEATEELLHWAGFEENLKEAQAEVARGETIAFQSIRRDV